MSCYPKGLIWQASPRYGNRIMTEEEVNDFDARAALGLQASQKAQGIGSRRRRKSMDVKVHILEDSSCDSPTHQLYGETELSHNQSLNEASTTAAGGSRKGKESVPQFDFGGSQLNHQRPSQFSFRSEPPGDVQANIFCRPCQNLIRKSRAIRWTPPEGAQGGFGIYVEGQSAEDEDQCVDVFRTHYYSFAELCKSASEGCHLCSLLAAPDPHADENPPDDCQNEYVVGVYGSQSYDGPGRIEMQVAQYGRKVIDLSYDCPTAKFQGPLRYRRTDTEQLFILAKDWLRQCRLRHDECFSSPEPEDFIPTRLLEVAAAPDGKISSIKLRITNFKDFHGVEYLALSHCWGGAKITRLETSTFQSFQESIPLDSLPQNFIDAAIITARLGFKYIWIDSCCIIQDSKLDCSREIPTMDGVYGRATLTIAALGAENSHGGCFVTRNPLTVVPTLLRDGDKRTRDQVWAWNQPLREPSAGGKLRPPLHQRGWVVQERALAHRTLNFGKDMVYWECRCGGASEATPNITRGFYERGLKIALQQCRAMPGKTWADWEKSWWEIVREYSASKLSFNSDKWNAISALAMQAERDTGGRLYHGLWESNLFEDVMWKCFQPGTRVEPAHLDVPSWSWLSVDGPVHNQQRFDHATAFKKVATVEKPKSTRYSNDGLGRSNTLIVCGTLLKILSASSSGGSGKRKFSFIFRNAPILPSRSMCDWYPDVGPNGEWDDLSIIPMVVSRSGACEAYGLVVRPNDEFGISWARVGTWQMFFRWDYERSASDEVQDGDEALLHLQEESLLESEWSATLDPEKKESITLV